MNTKSVDASSGRSKKRRTWQTLDKKAEPRRRSRDGRCVEVRRRPSRRTIPSPATDEGIFLPCGPPRYGRTGPSHAAVSAPFQRRGIAPQARGRLLRAEPSPRRFAPATFVPKGATCRRGDSPNGRLAEGAACRRDDRVVCASARTSMAHPITGLTRANRIRRFRCGSGSRHPVRARAARTARRSRG